MTVEEKRKMLKKHCDTHRCSECVLDEDLIPCGRGFNFFPDGGMSADKVLLAYDIVFGEKNMKKGFTKANLKNGDVVLLRNGIIGIVCVETNTLICETNTFSMSAYNAELKHSVFDYRDIIAVRRGSTYKECNFLAFELKYGELLWERKEVEEMTLEEVCKALGKEIKIVKEKH